jgi:CRISPR-associated endonuclease Cas3-HD
MIDKIFAKDNKTTLVEHSKKVSEVALRIADLYLIDPEPELIEIIRVSSLLHDIGKCTLQFQKVLKNLNFEIDEMEGKIPYRHNEVGWAFLSRYFKSENKDEIIEGVYWHHGITNKMCGYNDTDIKISDADAKKMKEFVKNVVGESYIIENPPYKPKKAPKFYYEVGVEDKNAINLVIRYCVMYADRVVSKFGNNSVDEIVELCANETKLNKKIDFSNHKYSSNSRFKEQLDISRNCKKTNVINAPAGYGKTLISLMWMELNEEKMLFVCPRNNIAENLYNSVLRELDDAGITNLSVELYLGGETKKHNSNFTEEFSSDIIITNIDNFLRPTIDNSDSNKLHAIMTYNVVFDEYQELVSDVALFAGFINIMRVRHRIINKKTILLSATHELIYKLWESDCDKIKTTHLPEKFKHYPAIHQKKYKLKTFNNAIQYPTKDSLIISNSVRQSQAITFQTSSSILIHNRFEDDKKAEILTNIHNLYGKGADTKVDRPLVVAAPIIQASYDLSFPNVYEYVLSPGATMQRCTGRCNRFGELDGCTINILETGNLKEEGSIKNLYSNKLALKWFRYISNYNDQELTADQLYEIYNKYLEINEQELTEFLIDKFTESLDKLSEIYPKKRKSLKKSDVKVAGSNKLRQSGYNEIFIICPKHNSSKEFINPFSVPIYQDTFEEEFDEFKFRNILNRQKKIMKNVLIKDDRFGFDKILELDKKNKMSSGVYRIESRLSITPYIVLDRVCHPLYGVILEKDLKKF